MCISTTNRPRGDDGDDGPGAGEINQVGPHGWPGNQPNHFLNGNRPVIGPLTILSYYKVLDCRHLDITPEERCTVINPRC